MGNLSYIDELGIGSDEPTSDDGESNNQNGLNDSDDSTPSEEESIAADTEQQAKYADLQKQISVLEKRISDKDTYINELREQSKAKELAEDNGDVQDDFWSNPEEHYKKLKETIKIQQMQIAETVYANTVDGYWKTVNGQAIREAAAADPEFADRFNKSKEPYRVAYEYLSNRNKSKADSEKSLRDSIRAEILKELGVKNKPDTPPSMAKIGGSNGSSKAVSDDGFASVFGSEY